MSTHYFDENYRLAQTLGYCLQKHSLQLVVAESCTGGGIAAAITDIAGSSAWFERGFVTYSNSSKQDLLGVHTATLTQYGAVSLETALEMAQGALKNSSADLAIAVTGIAGPGGGSVDKPIGTVFIAWQFKNQQPDGTRLQLDGDRTAIRQQVIEFCLKQLTKLIDS